MLLCGLQQTCPCQFQITQLPDVDFWKRFKKLQLLNLHDNNMSTRQHVIGLSGCPNLYALTLNDTPLSLRGSYRHCIVNSLWSLKALDKYVIADEEIIEGFTLTPKFKKMTPNLAVDLHPASKMVSVGPSSCSVQCNHMSVFVLNFVGLRMLALNSLSVPSGTLQD